MVPRLPCGFSGGLPWEYARKRVVRSVPDVGEEPECGRNVVGAGDELDDGSSGRAPNHVRSQPSLSRRTSSMRLAMPSLR
jgi:hypothetical protein